MKITLWMTTSLNSIIATSDNKEGFLSDENLEDAGGAGRSLQSILR